MSNRTLPQSETKVKSNDSRFKAYSLADLDGMDLSVQYIFRDALVAGVPGVLGARQKSLKSSIALDAAVSMAAGTPWLGRFECVRPARGVYFAGEGGLVFARDCLRRICESKQLDFADVDGLRICDAVPSLTNVREVGEVMAVVRDHGAEIAFFDPLYLMLGDGAALASNVFAMGHVFQQLLRACDDEGVTPFLLHHFRKSTDGAAPELSDLSQSGCSEFAGQWVLINRQRPYDEDSPGEHDLLLTLGARTGHSSRWAVHVSEGAASSQGGRYWRPEVLPLREDKARRAIEKQAAADQRRRETLEEHAAKITAALVSFGEKGATKTALREHAGLSGSCFNPALAELLARGDVVRCDVHHDNNRKKPYAGFRLSV